MECQKVSQEANTLHIEFKYTHDINSKMQTIKSSQYLCGALYTEFKCTSSRCIAYNVSTVDYVLTVMVKFHKLLEDDDFTYVCKLENTTNDLLVRKLIIYDDNWHQIAVYKSRNLASNAVFSYTFNVTLNCEFFEGPQSVFVSLCDDTQSADFKLCGDGGSVKIHKPILAAHSPVLQSMLAGDWKESEEGSVALPGVSLDTLQHLKDYMYLNRLPETGLQELCVLASCYMMPRLAVQCCAKLLNYLTIDNVIQVAEFASRYRVEPLYVAVLKTMQGNKAKIAVLDHKTNWVEVCKKITKSTECAD